MKKYRVNKLRFTIFVTVVIFIILIPVLLVTVKSRTNDGIYSLTANGQSSKDNLKDAVPTGSAGNRKSSNEQSAYMDQPIHSIISPGITNSFSGGYKSIVYSGSSKIKEVAFTFDDGPDQNFTGKILDILREYNVKATFFVIGENAKAYPSILKRIANEGHAIGNHTYDHANLNRLSEDQIRSEITKTDSILDSIIGQHLSILRPPYGISSKQALNVITGMGYKVIDWSVDTKDWAGTPPEKMMVYFQKEVQPGAIILHHCFSGKPGGLNNTLISLPKEISILKAKGYHFVTIPDLIGTN